MSDAWQRLRARMVELRDLTGVMRLLSWDQHTTMPPGGAAGRARMAATMGTIAHAKLTDPEVGALLDELGDDGGPDEDSRASIRILRRDHERATKVPAELVAELAALQSESFMAWSEARSAGDFSILEPQLKRMVHLKKQEADAIGWTGERYDALLDLYEPDATTAEIESLFADLVARLQPLAEAILARAGERPAFLRRGYPAQDQETFARWLTETLGFDPARGRLDPSPHPFTTGISAGDVRQTTRYMPDDILMSLRATMHETGHALYEQNLPPEIDDLPAGHPRSLGLHESQSRMFEIQVGLSRAFSAFYFPRLKETFPEQLAGVDEETFYRGINHPRRSTIRVMADEVTYNLHVALRLELELAMFRDELEVADLPGAWDAAMERYVGIRPPDASEGVLQDMHWAVGILGYFPTYTLGTLYAAAFFEKVSADLPDLERDMARGHLGALHDWMRARVWERAYRASPRTIAGDILGGPLTPDPFLRHLERKHGELFGPLA